MSLRSDAGNSSRARARRAWPVRRLRRGDDPGDDLSSTTSAEERLAMMWPLAIEAWSLTGRPMPDYGREDTPVRRLPLSVVPFIGRAALLENKRATGRPKDFADIDALERGARGGDS